MSGLTLLGVESHAIRQGAFLAVLRFAQNFSRKIGDSNDDTDGGEQPDILQRPPKQFLGLSGSAHQSVPGSSSDIDIENHSRQHAQQITSDVCAAFYRSNAEKIVKCIERKNRA